jgi:hypothetical protein
VANKYLDRLRSAVNVFLDRNQKEESYQQHGPAYSIPQFKPRLGYGNERSIVGAIYTRIAVDVSMIKFRHVRMDENDNYVETIDSGLNSCLSLEANLDQTNRDFIQDIAMSMFDEGSVAIIPTDTSVSIVNQNAFDILTMRTGKIVQWYPHHVRVSVYNENKGEREEIVVPKSNTGIIQNPFYSIMNERNSIAQRLIAKLNLLDAIDQQSGSGKLDLIIQLPYVVKSETRKAQAEERRTSIQEQLKDSQYGIAYTDGTEKITQLNRPVENNLMAQIEYLTRMLYSQLGLSEKILDGTADENELISYFNRVIEPICSTISIEMKRKFISRTAQTQGQSVKYFRDLFSIVTPERLPDLADKLTRNEIASPNDIRAVIGWKPSKAKGADEIRNRNIAEPKATPEPNPQDVTQEFASLKTKENNQNGRQVKN